MLAFYHSAGRLTQSLLIALLWVGAFASLAYPLPQSTQALASINLEEYETFISPEPTSADDFYNRGLFLQGEGNLEAALGQFNQAIALSPETADYYFSRGLTYSDLGNHQKALIDYNRAIALDQTFAAAYFQRGMSRIYLPIAQINNPQQPNLSPTDQAKLNLAIQDFSQAIQYSPDFVAAYYYRGLSQYLTGHEAMAWQDYQQAKILNPKISEAFYAQGFTRLYIGGPQE